MSRPRVTRPAGARGAMWRSSQPSNPRPPAGPGSARTGLLPGCTRTSTPCWPMLRTQPSVAVGGEGETNWRLDPKIAGAGTLLAHGWHAFYCLLRWLPPPQRIAARLEKRRFTELAVEDTATVELDCGSGSG